MTPPRRRCRFHRRRDLVERLAPYVQPIEPKSERLVTVEPIRWWLEGWAAATGDRPEVIARGFDLDAQFVDLLLAGEIRIVRIADAAELSRALGIDSGLLQRHPLT